MLKLRKASKKKATATQLKAELERRIRALPDRCKECRQIKIRSVTRLDSPVRGGRSWDAQPMVLFGACRRAVADIIEQMVQEYDCVED